MGSVIGSYKKITGLVVVRVGTECLGMPTILPGSFPRTYSAFSSWLHSTELGWCSGSDVQMEGRKRVDSEQGLPAHWPPVRPWWCHTRAVLARLVSDPSWDGGHVARESLGRQLWWVEFSGRPGVGRITEMTFCSLPASSGVSSSRKLALTFQSGGALSTPLPRDSAPFTFAPGCWWTTSAWTDLWTASPFSVFLSSFGGKMTGRRISSLITRIRYPGTTGWMQQWPHQGHPYSPMGSVLTSCSHILDLLHLESLSP